VEEAKEIYHFDSRNSARNPFDVADAASTIDCVVKFRRLFVGVKEVEEGRKLGEVRKKGCGIDGEDGEGSNRIARGMEEGERKIGVEVERKKGYSVKGESEREKRIEGYADMTSKKGGSDRLPREGEKLRVVVVSANRLKCSEEWEEREVEVEEEGKKRREAVVERKIASIDRIVEKDCGAMALHTEEYRCTKAFQVEGEDVEKRSKIVRNLQNEEIREHPKREAMKDGSLP